MLTKLNRYHVGIGTLTYFVDIVNIVDIAMLTNSCRYLVYIFALSLIPRLHRSRHRHFNLDDHTCIVTRVD